jgi:hypothetical protein
MNGVEYLLKAVSTQAYLALVIGSLFHAHVFVELAVRMRGLEPHARTVYEACPKSNENDF